MREEEQKLKQTKTELVEDREPVQTSSAISPDDRASLLGKKVAQHYEIISLIGEGGISAVYKARHELLGNLVAIKFLLPGKQFDRNAIMRFQREAQSTLDLKHPSIASTKEFGIFETVPYMVLEYVEGESLDKILEKEKKLEPERALRLLREVAEALSFAHGKGVVHRDIKPSNIMVCKSARGAEEIKLIDFGIAKSLLEEGDMRNLTQTGEVFGTPTYMSPEQCRGERADFRTDIYSLGCVAYEMFSGQPPFTGSGPIELITKHLSETQKTLRSPRGMNGLDRVLDATLAKEPGSRYQSCEELLMDIISIEEGRPPIGKPVKSKNKLAKKLLVGTTILMTLILITMLLLINTFKEESLQSLTETIKREPNRASNYINRAHFFIKEDRQGEAISDLTMAIKLDPNGYRQHKLRSETYARLNQLDRAEADATRAIEINPSEYRGYLARGMARCLAARYGEAVDDLTRSLELNKSENLPLLSNRVFIYYYLAVSHNGLGEHEKALQEVDKALVNLPAKALSGNRLIDRHITNSLIERARANLGLGKAEEAKAALEDALDIDPANKRAQALRDEFEKPSSIKPAN